MSLTGIQGHSLEVTVVACSNLKDSEWISRQDPYVCLEYANFRHRTKTCIDGGKNPSFQEKFICTLIEGLRELNVNVWNSNTLTADDLIGSGKIQLHKVLTEGYDDTAWPIQGKYGRYSGEVRLVLHYSNAQNKTSTRFAPTVPSYATPNSALTPVYSYDTAPPPVPGPGAPYPTATTAYSVPPYPPVTSYSASSPYTTYTPSSSYPPSRPPAGYPSQTYPPPHQPLTSQPYQPPVYPPPPTPSASQPYPPPPTSSASQPYPPPPQPPASQAYPPPPQAFPYYPSAQYPAIYPPPPY